MNCKEIQQNLDVLNENRLHSGGAAEIQSHLDTCPACRSFDRDVRQLKKILHNAELPPLPESIQRRLYTPGSGATYVYRWIAAAALLLITFGLGFLAAVNMRRGDAVQAGTVSVSHAVVLAIDSDSYRQGVTFRLLLPPGVEVEGHRGETLLEWQDDLAAGVNRLRIPLILSGQDHGVLITQVEYHGKIQELKVHLDNLTGKQPTVTGDTSPRRAT